MFAPTKYCFGPQRPLNHHQMFCGVVLITLRKLETEGRVTEVLDLERLQTAATDITTIHTYLVAPAGTSKLDLKVAVDLVKHWLYFPIREWIQCLQRKFSDLESPKDELIKIVQFLETASEKSLITEDMKETLGAAIELFDFLANRFPWADELNPE